MSREKNPLEQTKFRANLLVRQAKPGHCAAIILFTLLCATWLFGGCVIGANKQDAAHFSDYFNDEQRLQDVFIYNNGRNQHMPETYPEGGQGLVDNLQNETSLETTNIMTYRQLIQISNNHLLLVNKIFAASDDISGIFTHVSDYVWTLDKNIVMNKDALEALSELFAYAANAGHDQFRVTEGYRTYEQQTTIYDTADDKSLVALPGHSEHHLGLAADISYHGVNIANSVQGTWLMENAYKYGFVLRYPKHKTEITGIPFEPWHYRFVGQPHAYFMYENDFVLEEYIKYLQANIETPIIFNGVEYRVYYLDKDDEAIEIPHNYMIASSLDNTGGLIATMWAKLSAVDR